MTYKQNWGLSRRHYQGKTSPLNQDMPHIERLDEQSKKKFAGIETKRNPAGNTHEIGRASCRERV